MLGEYQRGPGAHMGITGEDGAGAEGGGPGSGGGTSESDQLEYGWDAADVRAMQKQYANFLRASKAGRWWRKGE